MQRRRLRRRAARVEDSESSDSDVQILTDGGKTKRQSAQVAWECPMCTYINEDANATRCEVCESARPGRPTKARKLTQWLSQPVEKTRSKLPPLGAKKEPIELIDSGDSGDDASVTSSAGFYSDKKELSTQRSNGTPAAATTARRGLWADLYAPKTVDELCVNKKKVQEITEWLVQNASPTSKLPQKRLLFLCGSPGSGKSTAVRCIARQLGLIVKEWEDNSAAGKLNYDRMLREDIWTLQVSGVDDFSDFIHRSSAYAALPFATSRSVPDAGRKRKLPSDGNNVADASSGEMKRPGQLILIESWPQSWSKESSEYEEKLQRIYQHVVDPAGGCRYPVVCIYSDVQGSKIDLDHLSRKFSRAVMLSTLTTIININAVTAAQLKKHLTRVAAQEKCAAHPEDIQNIIDNSNGDIRHALNMLQTLQAPNKVKRKTPGAKKKKQGSSNERASTSPSVDTTARDPFLSDFHVVGKLLHGKMTQSRVQDVGTNKTNEIDYDQILEASAMPLDRVLGLVHENSIAYFSQVEDLADALELMSLCEEIVADSYNSISSSEAYKRSRDVAQAILMRTVAVTNANPAPKAFRPITRPRTYVAKQRMVSRREEMLLATRGGEHGLQHACTGDAFAFEVEPFLTIMDGAGGPANGPASHHSGGSFALDTLSIQEEVDDEIENSDDDW